MLLVWLEALDIPARITSGHRSSREQRRLYERYLRGESAIPVAPPGRSLHERRPSLAFDLVTAAGFQEWAGWLAPYLGLRWGGRSDPVHFSR